MNGRPAWPRARVYPILGALLGLSLPAGLSAMRALLGERAAGLDAAVADVDRMADTYAYLTIAGVAGLAVLGRRFGLVVDRLRLLSDTDPLTGLLNRRRFDERLVDEIARNRRWRRPMALLCVDIDRLKSTNDRSGHAAGDLAIVLVARTLQSCARSIDAVARVGGDEFSLVLPETSATQAMVLCRRILDELGRHEVAGEPITVSIGIAEGDGASDLSADRLRVAADVSLYCAKAAGGGCVAPDPRKELPIWPGGSTLTEARHLIDDARERK